MLRSPVPSRCGIKRLSWLVKTAYKGSMEARRDHVWRPHSRATVFILLKGLLCLGSFLKDY